MVVRVEAYSGHKQNERPLRFELGDRWLEVEEVLDRWYDPDAVYFKVKAGDGNVYILRYSEMFELWTLSAYRREPG